MSVAVKKLKISKDLYFVWLLKVRLSRLVVGPHKYERVFACLCVCILLVQMLLNYLLVLL